MLAQGYSQPFTSTGESSAGLFFFLLLMLALCVLFFKESPFFDTVLCFFFLNVMHSLYPVTIYLKKRLKAEGGLQKNSHLKVPYYTHLEMTFSILDLSGAASSDLITQNVNYEFPISKVHLILKYFKTTHF